MPREFDTSLKSLVARFPVDWLRLAGIEPRGAVKVLDANLSSVQVDADKVLRVARPGPQFVHFEMGVHPPVGGDASVHVLAIGQGTAPEGRHRVAVGVSPRSNGRQKLNQAQ